MTAPLTGVEDQARRILSERPRCNAPVANDPLPDGRHRRCPREAVVWVVVPCGCRWALCGRHTPHGDDLVICHHQRWSDSAIYRL